MDFRDGLKSDLIAYHLSMARTQLTAGLFHETVLHANEVLSIEPYQPQALHLLHEAAERLRTPGPLPDPMEPAP